MKDVDLIKLSLSEAAKYIKNGSFSAHELLDAIVKHVNSVNYNAILTLYKHDAEIAADKIDRALAKGEETGVLAGVPIIIKDNIDVAGYASTCGSAAFRTNIATSDAEAVKKLKAAGAVILGKANMDEFAMGSSNMTSAFGPVKNPLDIQRVPGGSSGGSAAAVASFQCFAALGSDTGGSIRQPASYCGVVGLKPTYGSINGRGCFPLAPSMDQIGPLTRTVGDCAMVFSVLAGKTCKSGSDFSGIKSMPKKVGIIKESLPEIRGEAAEAFNATLKKLNECSCDLQEVSVPSFMRAQDVYKTVAFSEITLSLRAVKEGRNLLGREVKKRIIAGRYVLDNPSLLEEAQQLRKKLTGEMTAALSGVDIIVLPSAPSVAFRLDDNPSMHEIKFSDVFAQPASIAGLPALSVPFYKNAKGLPLGIQLVGKAWGEADVFAAGKLLLGEK